MADFHRWLRERRKWPELGMLTPGTRLTRVYKGKEYVIDVTPLGYIYEGVEYPTLYAVLTEIAPRTLIRYYYGHYFVNRFSKFKNVREFLGLKCKK